MNAEFPVDVASVNIDRMDAHAQSCCYLLQPQTIKKQIKHLSLAGWKIILALIQLSRERKLHAPYRVFCFSIVLLDFESPACHRLEHRSRLLPCEQGWASSSPGTYFSLKYVVARQVGDNELWSDLEGGVTCDASA
jgi:hypothetical protein